MTDRKESATVHPYGGGSQLQIRVSDHTPHWSICGDGHATMNVTMGKPKDSGWWFSVDTEEHGQKSSKRTMITLNQESTLALRDYITHRMGGPSYDELVAALQHLIGRHDQPHGFNDADWYEGPLAIARAALAKVPK